MVVYQTTLACLHLFTWSLKAKLGAWYLSGFPGLWVPMIQLKYRCVVGGELDPAPKSSLELEWQREPVKMEFLHPSPWPVLFLPTSLWSFPSMLLVRRLPRKMLMNLQ